MPMKMATRIAATVIMMANGMVMAIAISVTTASIVLRCKHFVAAALCSDMFPQN